MSNIGIIKSIWNYLPFFLKKKLLKHIHSQSTLFYISVTDKNQFLRQEAIDLLTNSDYLAQVVDLEPLLYIKQKAVKRIKHEALLKEIALHHKHPRVRKVALAHLSDHDTISFIARNDVNAFVRLFGVTSIEDLSTLKQIADNDTCEFVSLAAKKKISMPYDERNVHNTKPERYQLTTPPCIRCGMAMSFIQYGITDIPIQQNLVAYKCNSCGALQCKSCAELSPCIECSGSIFQMHIIYEPPPCTLILYALDRRGSD